MKKKCHSSRSSLLQQPFIRIVTTITVASVKAYHYNQPLSKCYSTFLRQVYLPGYTKVFWIINVDFAKQTIPQQQIPRVYKVLQNKSKTTKQNNN